MPAYIFDKLLEQGIRERNLDTRSVAAREWFRQEAQQVRQVNVTRFVSESRSSMTNVVRPGHMYCYWYKAKHAATLPYYDRFPLIFPFRRVDEGFYGINMHYLHPRLRARLMDALWTTISDENMNEMTRLRFTYQTLMSAARFKYFKPCIKHYLNTQVGSRFIHIVPEHWEMALFLPMARFIGAQPKQVYQDSLRKIQNG